MSHVETLSSESVAKAYCYPFGHISHGGVPRRILGSGGGEQRTAEVLPIVVTAVEFLTEIS